MLKGRIKVKATDFSVKILERARAGFYTQAEVQRGLPITLLMKYFEDKDNHWKVKNELKNDITFQRLNLHSDPFGKESFHIILCRNVLIYQVQDNKREILKKLTRNLSEDGALFLGSSENLISLSDELKPRRLEGTTFYQKQSALKNQLGTKKVQGF